MRKMGGAVPSQPDLSNCSEPEALLDRIVLRERVKALNRAIDTVVDWCEHQRADYHQGGTRQAETTGIGSDKPGEEQSQGTAVKNLAPSRVKALSQYRDAVNKCPNLKAATDCDVYKWIKDHSDGDSVPTYATWSRYLREARGAVGTSKNAPRSSRTGRSIVRVDEI
jgi:hypothetical protein